MQWIVGLSDKKSGREHLKVEKYTILSKLLEKKKNLLQTGLGNSHEGERFRHTDLAVGSSWIFHADQQKTACFIKWLLRELWDERHGSGVNCGIRCGNCVTAGQRKCREQLKASKTLYKYQAKNISIYQVKIYIPGAEYIICSCFNPQTWKTTRDNSC